MPSTNLTDTGTRLVIEKKEVEAMDPINALVLSAPPEWIPILILAALLLKGYTAWLDKKKTAQLLDAKPAHVEEEITKEPDVKG